MKMKVVTSTTISDLAWTIPVYQVMGLTSNHLRVLKTPKILVMQKLTKAAIWCLPQHWEGQLVEFLEIANMLNNVRRIGLSWWEITITMLTSFILTDPTKATKFELPSIPCGVSCPKIFSCRWQSQPIYISWSLVSCKWSQVLQPLEEPHLNHSHSYSLSLCRWLKTHSKTIKKLNRINWKTSRISQKFATI